MNDMQERQSLNHRTSTRQCFARLFWGVLVAASLAGGSTGCTYVGPQQQRLVSKPNMEFSDSPVFSYQNNLTPQLEPGSAAPGSVQSSGCTSCK
jgi:hypothetical protein